MVPMPPGASEWLDETPVLGQKAGQVRLSEKAANWITAILGGWTTEKKLRKVEHACLDDSEKQGLITQ